MDNSITPDFSSVLSAGAPSAPPKQMLTVERDGNQTLVRINSSSLSIIQACPRKAFYTLHEGWRGKASSPALTFGTAVHKALEVFYAFPKGVRDIPAGFDEHAAMQAHGYPAPEEHFLYDAVQAFVVAGESLRMLPDTDKRSLASGIWLLGHYFKTYINDAYVTYCDAEGPLTERTFSTPLLEAKDLRIDLFGTIDFVLRNEVTGELLPGDHKTSSQMGTEFFNRLKPNHQYTGYVFGAQRALGIPVENFLVNGLGVKARPVTARGGPPTFTRQITRRTEQDIAEFINAVEFAVRSYLQWEAANVWPLGSVDSCALWGGCGFLDVCSAPNALRQNILESKFMGGSHASISQ